MLLKQTHLQILTTSSRHIKLAAHETNGNLYRVIQSLPLQIQPCPSFAATITTAGQPPTTATSVAPSTGSALSSLASSPPSSLHTVTGSSPAPIRKDYAQAEPPDSARPVNDPLDISTVSAPPIAKPSMNPIVPSLSASNIHTLKSRPSQPIPISEPVTPVASEFPSTAKTRSQPESPGPAQPQTAAPPMSPLAETIMDDDPFDVRETVNVLTLQFLSDHAETRIAALEWLLMLHLKAPNKVTALLKFVGIALKRS